ncbi:casein kinase 1, epsilon [Lanmaoa asiatica]|nr:casein kinase 1, epsilon [Lanmaoa asiatica]
MYRAESTTRPNIVRVDSRYRVGEELGEGSYSIVYRAHDILTNQQVAIKLQPYDPARRAVTDSVSCLEHEYEVLKTLQGGIGVPQTIWLGQEGSYRAMILESLGPSLQNLFDQTPSTTSSLVHVAKLGIQMISRLEFIHSRNFIHRDIKPHNFLMGEGESKDLVFLIDFGIAQRYRNPSSRIHVPMRERLAFVGTPAFASVNGHHGFQLGRRDDIESLAYTLIYLQHGSLPWLTRDGETPSCSTIRDVKQAFLSESEACGIPNELAMVFHHARSLDFIQRPDYDYLRTALQSVVDATPWQPLLISSSVPSIPTISTAAMQHMPIPFTPASKSLASHKSKETTRKVRAS